MKRLALAAALTCFAAFATAAPLTYEIDPNHTQVLASWSHFGFSNPVANFGEADGAIVYDAENVSASSVEVTLPLSGLNAFVPDFNDHLRSADFFEAEKYPQATFKSTKVEAAGKDKLRVTGDLTIRGVTRSVDLDVNLNKAGMGSNDQPRIGFDASTTIKRSDFGLGKYLPNVSDEVTLRITTEAGVPKPVDTK